MNSCALDLTFRCMIWRRTNRHICWDVLEMYGWDEPNNSSIMLKGYILLRGLKIGGCKASNLIVHDIVRIQKLPSQAGKYVNLFICQAYMNLIYWEQLTSCITVGLGSRLFFISFFLSLTLVFSWVKLGAVYDSKARIHNDYRSIESKCTASH